MSEACSSEPLVLSALSSTATIQPGDLALALWVLSTPDPPSKVVLPSSLVLRRRLARAGLVFAADRRGVELEIEGEPVPVSTALGVEAVGQTLALEQFDLETSDRMRVVSRLESREPPVAGLLREAVLLDRRPRSRIRLRAAGMLRPSLRPVPIRGRRQRAPLVSCPAIPSRCERNGRRRAREPQPSTDRRRGRRGRDSGLGAREGRGSCRSRRAHRLPLQRRQDRLRDRRRRRLGPSRGRLR